MERAVGWCEHCYGRSFEYIPELLTEQEIK